MSLDLADHCTKCGACCRRAWTANGILPVREDGACVHLIEMANQSLCAIYDARPDICRYGFARTTGDLSSITEEQYLSLSIAHCNTFQVEDGLPLHFRIEVPAQQVEEK